MADELMLDWKHWSLTKAEDEIIDFEPEENEDMNTQVSLCLVGKLNMKNPFNSEALK